MKFKLGPGHRSIHVQRELDEGSRSLVAVTYGYPEQPVFVLPIERLADEEFTVEQWREFVSCVDYAIQQAGG